MWLRKLCFQLLISKVLPHQSIEKPSYTNEACTCTILCFQSASLASLFTFATGLFPDPTGQTYKQGIFSPFCVNWPEHARPRQRLWSSAELLLICTCIEDFSLYLPQGCLPAHTGSAGHPHLANCSQPLELSLLQTNAFISIFISTTEFRLQLQCENLLRLKWCWKFMSWWNPCFGSSSDNNGKFLPLLIVKAS